MRIAIIGIGGQLGSDLRERLAKTPDRYEVAGLDLPDFDVCNHAAVRARLSDIAPEFVVNMAAFHQVDVCEEDVATSFEVNAIAVHNLAKVCCELDAPLMHFSSDYVFGADRGRNRPYTETDAPGPLSVYGASKLAGEHLARLAWRKHFIVRTCGLYGRTRSQKKGGNFVDTMMRLAAGGQPIKVVNDQRLTPTSTFELAQRLEELLRTEAYGLYHLTATGDCTWYEFARAIFEIAGVTPQLTATTSAAYGAKAERPRYSVLDNKAARECGLTPMQPWRDAVAEYLAMTGHRR